uniref:Merozoite surface glycoprotein gp45 n=1 Tax=Babesia bigemina TaxID=5866 RepID=H2CNQ6_BABBI|nr:merozoite surface glycoprotein gp45 [Babesia bigemina]
MMLATFSIAALCCLIAQTVRASTDPVIVPGTSRTSDPFGMAVAEQPRTLREEMHIVSKLLDVQPIVGMYGKNKPVLPEGVPQREKVADINAKLAALKALIDGEKWIFHDSLVVELPNYQGVNRYVFFKGLLKSMALKFETLYGFLSTATDVPESDLAKKAIELNLVKENEIVEGLDLKNLQMFLKVFYNKNSPLFSLLNLFDEYEANLSPRDIWSASTHPFDKFYEDTDGESEGLSTLDESNSRMEIHVPDTVKLPNLSVDVEERGVVVREDAEADAVQVNGERAVSGATTHGGDARGVNPTPGVTSSTTTTTPEPTSLRSGAAEASPKKASYAFEPFAMLLIVMSAAFAF